MTGNARRSRIWPFVIAGALTFTVASIGGAATDIGPWYKALNKPPWQPPDWLFPVAWTAIFAMIAASAALAWINASTAALRAWVLNVFWSVLFFTWKRPELALNEVVFLWLSIVLLMLATWRLSRPASLLLLPYLAWVSFASVLNLAIVQLNP